jgi:hypothetical protein
MLLSRVTPNPFDDYCLPPEGKLSGLYQYNYEAIKSYGDNEWMVVTRFERFGGGKHRLSDFDVAVNWKDVESIIEKFCEAGCLEALALRAARKLATAAKELGWQAPEIATTQASAVAPAVVYSEG